MILMADSVKNQKFSGIKTSEVSESCGSLDGRIYDNGSNPLMNRICSSL
jgi:hypothetical protein